MDIRDHICNRIYPGNAYSPREFYYRTLEPDVADDPLVQEIGRVLDAENRLELMFALSRWNWRNAVNWSLRVRGNNKITEDQRRALVEEDQLIAKIRLVRRG